MGSNPVPGWYVDGSGAERWWDGAGWTEHTRARVGEEVAAPGPTTTWSPPIAPGHTYRPVPALLGWLRLLLCIDLGIAVILVGFDITGLTLIHRILGGTMGYADAVAEANAHDAGQATVAWVQLAFEAATAVVFLVWVHRANRNARALGAQTMSFTPAWSVGWWFIPIAAFWMPFRAMREIWLASADPRGWRVARTPALLGCWWALWLLVGVVGNLFARLALGASTVDEVIAVAWWGLVFDVTDIALCVLAIAVVNGITAAQRASVAAMNALA